MITAAFPVLAFLTGLIFFAAVMSIFSGSASVSEVQIGLAISLIWFPVVLALPKLTTTPRVESWARGLAVLSAIVAVVFLLSLDDVFSSGMIQFRPSLWVPLAVIAIPMFLIVAWLYRRPRKISTPVPVGVTADIVEDLGQPGVFSDWLEYDFDGNPLPGTAREALGNAGEQYRSIGYDLRRWATDSPDALDEDFTPLRQVVAQALALLAFVGFAGLALAVSPSDTMQSVGKWLLFLAPMFGVYLLVRNFGRRRKN